MFLCSSPTCLFGRLSLARSLSLYHGLRGTPDACYSVVFAGPLASALGCLAACAEPASIQTRLGCTAQPPAHPACPRCVAVPCRADNTEHCRRRGHRAWVVYDHRCAGPSTSTPTPCLPIRMVATAFSAPSRAVPARHVRRRAGLLHLRPLTPHAGPHPAPPGPPGCTGWMFVVAFAVFITVYNAACGVHAASRGGGGRRGGKRGHGHSHGEQEGLPNACGVAGVTRAAACWRPRRACRSAWSADHALCSSPSTQMLDYRATLFNLL